MGSSSDVPWTSALVVREAEEGGSEMLLIYMSDTCGQKGGGRF